jgi:hypothetical protein
VRTVFLLLVLANLAFFAWSNFVADLDTQSDPRPIARQVAPEKLRILPPEPAAKAAAATVAPKPAAEAGPARTACLEWGGFSAADAARAGEALAPLALGDRLSQRQVDDSASWWVYIPPRASKQDAQKKAGELKARGVDEYFIVQDEGPFQYALSLGVFKTEAAAQSRLEALRAKDVRTALVGKRESQLQKTYFQVRAADDALAAKLRETAQSFAGSEVRECPQGPG